MEPNNNQPPQSPALPKIDDHNDKKSLSGHNDPDAAFSLCDAYMLYSSGRQAATHNTGASSGASNAAECLIGTSSFTNGEDDCKSSSNNKHDFPNKTEKRETTARDEYRMLMLMQNAQKAQKSNRKPNNVRISSHDVATQLLARIDNQSYQEAIDKDSKSINENYLLPFSFPWRQDARLPEKARDSFPRDIDDLHAVRQLTIANPNILPHLIFLVTLHRQLIVMANYLVHAVIQTGHRPLPK